jgi:GT2 family glycosyltransferase
VPDPSTVSVVICNWNAGDRTQRCLEQIRSWTVARHRFEILVQDNASTDPSWRGLSQAVDALASTGVRIRFRRLESHPGVTQAFNDALKYLDQRSVYVLRLDNDVELAAGALEALLDFMDSRPQCGIAGPRIVYAADPSRLNAGAIWLNRWGLRNRMVDSREPVECDALLGAVMIVRFDAIRAIGRWFDPSLFLFAEEPEFCWQITRAGYKVCYVPSALALHDTALSTGKHSKLSTYLNHRNNAVVLNRRYPGITGAIRNCHVLARLAVKGVITGSFLPLMGFLDGLRQRPLTEAWWQERLRSTNFSRPDG